MRRLTAAVAAVFVVLASPAGLAGSRSASAQTTGVSTIRLASKTPWVPPGGELVLRLLVTTPRPPADVELVVAVYRAVGSRSEFARTLTNRPRTVPLSVTPPASLAELPPDSGGAVVVRLPVQDPSAPTDDRSALRLGTEGVYPVHVELRVAGGGPALAGIVTHLVYTRPPGEGGSRLDVGLVLPIHAPPALRPDGTRRIPAATAERLAGLARSLAAPVDVPLTLLPTPETLEALASSTRESDRDAASNLAGATDGRQVAARTFVPVALPALVDAGLNREAEAELDRGNEVIERVLGTRPEARTWVADEALDEGAVAGLRAQQLDRLVIPESGLEPVDLDVTLTQPFELGVRAVRRPRVVAADTGLAAHFAGDDPVLAAHNLLADLAVLYRDRPSRRRAVVVMAPRSWRPSEAFVDTLLAGLESSPILRPVTLGTIFADVPVATAPGGAPLVRQLATRSSNRALPAADIRDARRRLQAFSSMLDPDNELDDSFERVLLVSLGSELRAADRRRYLQGLDQALSAQLDLIKVPENRSVTLTARRGEIPVTVLSRADYPVHLQIEVASDKLDFPQGAADSIDLTRRNTTKRFSVRARTSGAFPLRLQLSSPDGGMVVATSRFTVRSTAASGVGVFLSVGAGAFLLLWWARHLAGGRRNRRLVPS